MTEWLDMLVVGLIQAAIVVMFLYPFLRLFQRDEERERAFWRGHEQWMRDHRAKMDEIRATQGAKERTR